MKKIQQILLVAVWVLLATTTVFAETGSAMLKVDGQEVSKQSSITLGNAKLSLQLQGELQRIEMKIVSNGQVKNHASYQHLTAFNANASNMAKVMAKAGDEL